MTRFNYTARDRFGVKSSGYVDADSVRDVTAILEERKLIPVDISKDEHKAAAADKVLIRFEGRVKPEEILVFCQQMASLLNAGVTLIESLNAVGQIVKSHKLKESIRQVKEDIEQGISYSEALAKHQDVFPVFMVNMVKAGERSGILGKIMLRTVSIMEKDIDNRRKLKAAVRYPMFVMTALVVGFVAIVTLIIPRFAAIFATMQAELPLPTRMLIGANIFIRQYWLIIAVVLAAVYFGFRQVTKSPSGKLQIDRFLLAVPVSGVLLTKVTLARFARTFSAMLSSGITVVEALSISSKVLENEVFKRVVMGLREEIIKGESLSNAMRGANVFPVVVVQMTAVGEKAGNLEEMLDHVADYFEKETDYLMANMAAMIEPILILFLGLVVLVMALGVYLPMWDMMQIYR